MTVLDVGAVTVNIGELLETVLLPVHCLFSHCCCWIGVAKVLWADGTLPSAVVMGPYGL
jgi:hypothetical protein